MKSMNIIPAIAAALLASAACLFAAEPNINELTRELSGEKPAQQRAAGELEAVYTQVIAALVPDMGSDDAGKRSGAQDRLERIVFRASAPEAARERSACSKAIAANLEGNVPVPAKVWMIRQLERIGREEAVSRLAVLLSDPDAQVRDCARRALMKNSAPEASEPLRKAIAASDGAQWRAALINALASRQDPADLSLLIRQAASDEDPVRIAALRGLAKLGDKSALETIAAAMAKGSPTARQAATDSYLQLAEAVAAKGDQPAALAVYRSMLSQQAYLKCAGIIGLGRAGTSGDLPTIFQAAGDPDVRTRGACVEAMALMKGDDVTAAIVTQTKSADAQAKPALLQGLARRGDKSTLPTFAAAANDADEAVRVEAVRGLGQLGDGSAVPLLLQVAATAGASQEAARWGLQRVSGEDVDRALLSAMGAQQPKIRLEAIRALAMRHVVAAGPELLKAAEDADPGVRSEAIKALALVGTADSLAPLAAILVKTDDNGVRQDAASALANIANRETDTVKRSEPILAALGTANGPAKLALLGVLGRIGGEKSLETVRTAAKDTDAKISDAAIRAMAEWPDAAPAQDLLSIAKTAPAETHQVLAIRGCIRVVREDARLSTPDKAKLLVTALDTARRPQEKRQALGALAEVRHVAALEAVVPYLKDTALSQEAIQAALRIARDIANDTPAAAKSAMEKVLEVSQNPDIQRQAKETIDRANRRLQK